MATPPSDPVPDPIKTYTIYHRVARRKFPILLGTPSSASPAETPSSSSSPSPPHSPVFYILGPPPWALRRNRRGRKSPYLCHGKWLSTMHLNGNPKYFPYPTSKVLGVSTRGRWFSSFSIQIGGDAPRRVEEKRRVHAERSLVVSNRCRKVFCRGPKELEWEDAEGIEDHMGVPVNVEMKHDGHRKYEVVMKKGLEEVRLVVTGTRKYSKMGMKGVALSVKMVRQSDNAIVADLEITSKGSIKGDRDLGKQLGIVRIYENIISDHVSSEKRVTATGDSGLGTEEENRNVDAAIINVLWSMVQAEHLKREKVREILEEIAQEADGG